MELKKYIYGVALGALSLTYSSCYNAEHEFPDYEGGTTAYFAYQYPVRTLILGNDIYDNTLDNAHKCQIWSTMGGAYHGRDAVVSFVVDESLCDDLYFTDDNGNPAGKVTPMPTEYYKLASNTIPYNNDVRGNVEVQFTDAFFNDPKSIENTYVIPLLMKSATGIEHILVGEPRPGFNPVRTNSEEWQTLPKDFVLYCVKYQNPWQARYIRRGVDLVTEKGKTTEFVRKDTKLINSDPANYKENPVNANDEVCSITTKNMKQAIFPVSFQRGNGNASVSCNLILTFDGDKCTISTDDEGKKASGTGEFITKGTEQAAYKDYQWGSMNGVPVQRDILRLAYTVDFNDGAIQVSTNDTLVVQTRESNKKVFFTPAYIKK